MIIFIRNNFLKYILINMRKRNVFRLTESDLHRVIKSSVKKILREAEEPGSISHGTLKNEDLIPKYMSIIFRNDPRKAREIWQTTPELLQALCDEKVGVSNNWWDSEEACDIAAELMNACDEYAPEGHYFGSYPGDGSDIGYWENEY